MKLLIMRHGEAVIASGGKDADRPLTANGIAEVRTNAEWLRKQFGAVDLAIVSPYVRAQQTFSEVKDIVPVEVTETSDEVTPASQADVFASALLARLQIEPAETVLIVSHMPFVCYLLGYLDSTIQPPIFHTGGIAEVDVEPLAMAGKYVGMQAP